MNFDQWISVASQIYQQAGKEISPGEINFLSGEFPKNGTEEQKKFTAELYDVLMKNFFSRIHEGNTFGSLNRVKETFGMTLEENYKLSEGPFIAMAKTYWTFKIESGDILETEVHRNVLTQILFKIETQIRSVFFPTPGPETIPVKMRRDAQRELLREYAPSIDIERFLAESPILRKLAHEESGKGSGLFRRLFGKE